MNYRNLRVGNLIRDELAKIIMREMEFPDTLVTITEVVVDPKLGGAAVKVSVLPSEKAEAVLGALSKKRGKFQHLLNNKLNIKPMPRIQFEIDHGLEKAARVEKILLDE